jgi:NAD(P)-dependent dehydrogenase (short-subunit alcohol dehydrogenase family)
VSLLGRSESERLDALCAGRVAIVTGAGSGIGRAIATLMVEHGAEVVFADRDEAAAAEAAGRLVAARGGARAVALDVTDAAAFDALAAWVRKRWGRIDVLVGNAGVGLAGPTEAIGLEEWRRVIEVNVLGIANGIHAVYPMMVAQRGGRLIHVASGAGLAPRPGMVGYAASKHAVVGLSTSLAAEAIAHGVHVHVACPGWVDTGIFGATRFVGVSRERLLDALSWLPVKPQSPEACARAILRGVLEGRTVIPTSRGVALEWLAARCAPEAVVQAARLRARRFRASRADGDAAAGDDAGAPEPPVEP